MSTVTEMVRPLAHNGMTVAQIALATGLPRDRVCRVVNRLRERGEPVSRERSPRAKAVESAKAAAFKRGVTVRDLWAEVQRVIARDNLFDAILDDGEGADVGRG